VYFSFELLKKEFDFSIELLVFEEKNFENTEEIHKKKEILLVYYDFYLRKGNKKVFC